MPDREPTDEQRAASVDILQRAVGEGRLTLGEFTDRLDVVLAAATVAGMDTALADLPTELPVVGSAAPVSMSVFGDVRVSGRWRLREHNRGVTVFGDVRFDLRDSVCSEAEVHIEGRTVFGDVVVIVPAGVEAELSGFTVFGDRHLDLAPVPRQPHTPIVRVSGLTIFGDIRVRSLAPGESASSWRRALQHWRHVPPPALPAPPPPRRHLSPH
ncbi:MAG: DUF1707 domain-containing protein [Geodermatophilaceae bacterium]